ncbi:unnamed protein product [Effrenium voratum]|nr:unnamed protein product [Effrenium voratum]
MATGNNTLLDTTSDLAELGSLQEAFSRSFLMILVTELGAVDVWEPGQMPPAPSRPRRVLHKIFAHERSGGGGTEVRRPIRPDSEEAPLVDPVLVLDDFTVALPDGFPDHAHRGFSTLTYLLPTSPGSLTHEDFLGNAGTLRPGDAQWMTCGRGVLHSEVPESQYFARGLQLWINLPEKDKMSPPEYRSLPRAAQRRLTCQGVSCALLAGAALGAEAPGECLAAHFTMTPPTALHLQMRDGHTGFVYILEGEGSFVGEVASVHDCLILSNDEGEDGLVVHTEASEVSFFVFAGSPLREPVVWQGDKTFFIAALLAMRHDRLAVFFGAAGALAAMTALSATIGLVLPKLMPREYTHWAAVGLFVYFGIKLLLEAFQMLRSGGGVGPSEELEEVEQSLKDSSAKEKKSWAIAIQALTLTFLAEWGDRSQISTIALAAAKDPLGVTLGGIIGHSCCTTLAVLGGRVLAEHISERMVVTAGGVLFLCFAVHGAIMGAD